MAIHVIEKLVEVVASTTGVRADITFTSPRSNIMYVRSTVAGNVVQISVYHAGNVAGGQAAWNLRKNGTSLFSGASRPIVTVGNSFATKTGLSFSTAVGDLFQLDLDEVPTSGVPTPVVLLIFIDDGVVVPTYLDDLADVVATAPNDGDIIRWDSASGTWIKSVIPASYALASQLEAEAGMNNTKVTTPLRVAQAIAALSGGGTPTLAGDAIGASNVNKVVKIQNRQIKNWAVPVTFGDDFNAGAIDNAKWGVHTSQNTWGQSSGNLVFTRTAGSGSGHLFGKTAFDFTGKSIVLRIPTFAHAGSLQSFNIFFGVVTYDVNPTLYSGGTRPENFVGMRIRSYNGGYASQCQKYLSSGGVDVASAYGDALATQPSSLIDSIRIRDNGTGTVFYEVAYQSAPTVWVTLDSQAYVGPTVLSNKMAMIQIDADFGTPILVNAIESTVVSSDEIVNGDVVYWNSATQQFETKTIVIPTASAASVIDTLLNITTPPTFASGGWSVPNSSSLAQRGAGVVLLTSSASANDIKCALRALPSISTFDLKVGIYAHDYTVSGGILPYIGLGWYDSSGGTHGFVGDPGLNSSSIVHSIRNSFTSAVALSFTLSASSMLVNTRVKFYRVSRSGGGNYTFWVSSNGYEWFPIGTYGNTTNSGAADYIGVFLDNQGRGQATSATIFSWSLT